MDTFEEFIKNRKSIPFEIMSWCPRKHLRYWIYTWLLYIPIKSFRRYIFTKRCNFIHKPIYDCFKNGKSKLV